MFITFLIVHPVFLCLYLILNFTSMLFLILTMDVLVEYIFTYQNVVVDMGKILLVIAFSVGYVLSQYSSKIFANIGLEAVGQSFSNSIRLTEKGVLRKNWSKKSKVLNPFLVEGRFVFLAVPRILAICIISSFYMKNIFVAFLGLFMLMLYVYSAVKLERSALDIRDSRSVWDRLRVQNKVELIFSSVALCVCVCMIGFNNSDLGAIAVILLACFRVLIGDYSGLGYALPRQIRYVKNLPNWPKYWGRVRVWK